MPILTLLVALIVFLVVIWGAMQLLAAFATPEPLRTVVIVLIVIFGVLAMLAFLGYGGQYVRLR